MNMIKYINPSTGAQARVRLAKFGSIAKWDTHMWRKGFLRAGRRWAGAKARAALRAVRAAELQKRVDTALAAFGKPL